MKKLFAILLVLMMLMTAAASAETASVLKILDPVVTVDMGDGAETIDLTGLELDVAASESTPISVRLELLGSGENLVGATVQVADGRALIAIDGVSRPLYAELPEGVNSLAEFQMPEIDLSGVMETVMSQVEFNTDENGNMTFKAPYTAVNEVLEAVAPALENISIPGLDMSEVTSAFAQLKESNSGMDVEGSFAQADDGMALNLTLTAVQDGEATDQKIVIDFNADDASVTLDIDAAGQALIHIDAAPDGDYVVLNVEATAEGSSVTLNVKFTAAEGEEVDFGAIDAENAINVQELSEADEELSNELSGALGGVMNYFFGALANAA